MCVNGGNLVVCNMCQRCLCNKCIKITLNAEQIARSIFVCIACHNEHYKHKPAIYFVSQTVFNKSFDLTCFKQGFYQCPQVAHYNLDTLKPFAKSALVITSGYSMTSVSWVVTTSLLIIHFHLDSISTKGSPASLIHEYLLPFFKDSTSLHLEEVSFNLPKDRDVMLYHNQMKTLVEQLML